MWVTITITWCVTLIALAGIFYAFYDKRKEHEIKILELQLELEKLQLKLERYE